MPVSATPAAVIEALCAKALEEAALGQAKKDDLEFLLERGVPDQYQRAIVHSLFDLVRAQEETRRHHRWDRYHLPMPAMAMLSNAEAIQEALDWNPADHKWLATSPYCPRSVIQAEFGELRYEVHLQVSEGSSQTPVDVESVKRTRSVEGLAREAYGARTKEASRAIVTRLRALNDRGDEVGPIVARLLWQLTTEDALQLTGLQRHHEVPHVAQSNFLYAVSEDAVLGVRDHEWFSDCLKHIELLILELPGLKDEVRFDRIATFVTRALPSEHWGRAMLLNEDLGVPWVAKHHRNLEALTRAPLRAVRLVLEAEPLAFHLFVHLDEEHLATLFHHDIVKTEAVLSLPDDQRGWILGKEPFKSVRLAPRST